VGADVGVSGTTAGRDDGSNAPRFLIGRDVYAGARVTLHAMPSLRLFAKVGYSNTRFTSNQGYFPLHNGMSFSDTDHVTNNGGVRAGAGLQYTLFGPFYALAEYRYTRYSQQISRNEIVSGVGVRF
jgi:outer membrane immunogenic protein